MYWFNFFMTTPNLFFTKYNAGIDYCPSFSPLSNAPLITATKVQAKSRAQQASPGVHQLFLPTHSQLVTCFFQLHASVMPASLSVPG
jgi:hypothetical protein